jgi:type I restriction enzyme R subunit
MADTSSFASSHPEPFSAGAWNQNFRFLAEHDPLLVRLASLAELYCFTDPNTALFKLRQFAEVLTQRAAARVGVPASGATPQFDLLRELEVRNLLTRDLARLFHHIRKAGNEAAHEVNGTSGEVIHVLRIARELGIWFHRTFGKQPAFKPGAFKAPEPPSDPTARLREQIGQLRAELDQHRQRADEAGSAAAAEAKLRREADDRVRAAAADRDAALELAEEVERLLEQERARSTVEMASVRQRASLESTEIRTATLERAQVAAKEVQLDEGDTRKIIDEQLRDAGWEANSEFLRWSTGTRPIKGRNIAIAEYPTTAGPADYVLFVGLVPVAVVEAKRQAKNVASSIEQSKRYSRGFEPQSGEPLPNGPWGDYRIPFLFATNGRSYLKQIAEGSGVWFLDARRSTNHPRPLADWYSPEGLGALLKQDEPTADRALAQSPSDFLPLRDYQRAAIAAVEQEIAGGNRSMLLAMATGTGKTRTLICLIYRLLKAQRFRRVLFLVDRSALGDQTTDMFKDVALESHQKFTDIYDVKEMGDLRPDEDTKLQIATVQAMVKRVVLAPDEAKPPIDDYDCVVIDECHRGYTLDRELSDAELTFRDQADYISKYRRVLEHFDAVKIGVTATPALHTTEIFGAPTFTYSYRQAVIDGWLVDHEPPVRIRTKLGRDGIHYAQGEEVPVFDVQRAQIDLFKTPDEIDLDIEDFNKRVVTENFNRVVCEYLASQIDPTDPSDAGKTLVFCVNDQHADMVVRLLKAAFDERYGGVEDNAVVKITGGADQPKQLSRRYKNERLPNVAVTVDLLTTGIDVPEIANLVFLRRVRSRILYEQMLGRGTRLRPDLHGPGKDKEAFRIFDAVDLYSALEPHTAMTAVATDPKLTFAKLVTELQTVREADARSAILAQIIAKLQRKKGALERGDGGKIQAMAGTGAAGLLQQLRTMTPADAAGFFGARPALVNFLDRVYSGEAKLIVSMHEDEVIGAESGYGDGQRPADYIESFGEYVRSHINEIPALYVVTQRPRDLTRQQLKELALALDTAGYSERHLRAAWRDLTNRDIAATIIGFIRQQALKSELKPYAERVREAMQRILASRAWTQPQRKWLERIGRQIEREVIVDREALDRAEFKAQGGGYDRLDRIFDGHLGRILGDIQDALWQDSA